MIVILNCRSSIFHLKYPLLPLEFLYLRVRAWTSTLTGEWKFREQFVSPCHWRNVYSARETDECVRKNLFSPVQTGQSCSTVAFKNIASFSAPIRTQVFNFLKASIRTAVGLTSWHHSRELWNSESREIRMNRKKWGPELRSPPSRPATAGLRLFPSHKAGRLRSFLSWHCHLLNDKKIIHFSILLCYNEFWGSMIKHEAFCPHRWNLKTQWNISTFLS